jgi:hypothetical protein
MTLHHETTFCRSSACRFAAGLKGSFLYQSLFSATSTDNLPIPHHTHQTTTNL